MDVTGLMEQRKNAIYALENELLNGQFTYDQPFQFEVRLVIALKLSSYFPPIQYGLLWILLH